MTSVSPLPKPIGVGLIGASDFDDALRLHRLIDAIARSTATGQSIAL
jgi:hypothetical protein